MSGSGSSAQFSQLPMFMSAHEIRSQYRANDADREDNRYGELETDDELFDRKYEEADDSGLAHDVAKNGVSDPIPLTMEAHASRPGSEDFAGKPQMFGGHHRVAIMHRQRPHDLMPVEHYADRDAAR